MNPRPIVRATGRHTESFFQRQTLSHTRCYRFSRISPHRPELRFLERPVRRQLQYRHASSWQEIKRAAREHPYTMTLGVTCIAISLSILGWFGWWYTQYVIPSYENIPDPVAEKLRRAIYFTNIQLDVRKANKYYREALEKAQECGMDQWSDEVMGIKIMVAFLFEKANDYATSIRVLEIVKRDALRWLEAEGNEHIADGRRTKVLAKTCGIAGKLGELYGSSWIDDLDKAHEQLLWAVETVLKEQRRRDTDGVKEGEGDWMDGEEIGASMEALARSYQEKNQHYLAVPLYLQALQHCPNDSCHAVVLMTNLASAIAEQRLPPNVNAQTVDMPSFTEQARLWLQKSLDVAKTIPPDKYTRECDEARVAALHNLGELAEREHRLHEAKKNYEEAKKLAKGVDFADGVAEATASLKRVQKALAA